MPNRPARSAYFLKRQALAHGAGDRAQQRHDPMHRKATRGSARPLCRAVDAIRTALTAPGSSLTPRPTNEKARASLFPPQCSSEQVTTGALSVTSHETRRVPRNYNLRSAIIDVVTDALRHSIDHPFESPSGCSLGDSNRSPCRAVQCSRIIRQPPFPGNQSNLKRY
jgi:hypothetical protein